MYWPFIQLSLSYSKIEFEVAPSTPELKFEVVKTQEEIAKERCASLKGSTHKTLVTGFDQQKKLYKGRSYAFAPDDVDGLIYFSSNEALQEGEIVNVLIEHNFTHDLLGKKID